MWRLLESCVLGCKHIIFFFKQKTAYEIISVTGVQTCALPISANNKGELLTGGTRLTHNREKLHHHMGVAAFAEFTLVAEASAVKVPQGLAARDTCIFGCAVLCGAGTALNTAGVTEHDSVAVVGLGAVGLSAILGARAAGSERIIAIDRLEAKLAAASSLGATDVLVSDDQTPVRVAELTVNGVDHAIEASGTLEGFDLAMRLVRRGGTVTTLGLPGPGVVTTSDSLPWSPTV